MPGNAKHDVNRHPRHAVSRCVRRDRMAVQGLRVQSTPCRTRRERKHRACPAGFWQWHDHARLGRDDEFGRWVKPPQEIGGAGTQSAYVIVEDVDAHHSRAKAAGAEIVGEVEGQPYGAFTRAAIPRATRGTSAPTTPGQRDRAPAVDAFAYDLQARRVEGKGFGADALKVNGKIFARCREFAKEAYWFVKQGGP